MLLIKCDRKIINFVIKNINLKRGFRIDIAYYNNLYNFMLADDTLSIENLEKTY